MSRRKAEIEAENARLRDDIAALHLALDEARAELGGRTTEPRVIHDVGDEGVNAVFALLQEIDRARAKPGQGDRLSKALDVNRILQDFHNRVSRLAEPEPDPVASELAFQAGRKAGELERVVGGFEGDAA